MSRLLAGLRLQVGFFEKPGKTQGFLPKVGNQDPWADPKSRSTFGFCKGHHRNTGVQNWGIYFSDPRGGLGKNSTSRAPKTNPKLQLLGRKWTWFGDPFTGFDRRGASPRPLKGRILHVDPPSGPEVHTIGVSESIIHYTVLYHTILYLL